MAQHVSGAGRVLDIGGGYGVQAIYLARAGHEVIVLDLDERMISIAENKIAEEPYEVRQRIDLVLGDGAKATQLLGGGFDLVCCHSVLMYLQDPQPLLTAAAGSCRPGGLVSVLSINHESIAMRSALQRRWSEAALTLRAGIDHDTTSLPTFDHSRIAVEKMLSRCEVVPRTWYGVGVFTDHLTEIRESEDLGAMCAAEWYAGMQDPYRQVARCYHLIGERTLE
ncbi:hypothetical protein A8M60_04610 [Nocardia farcinica]|nr:hypothetical protein A8M60_04610 [Nocardia farcinica]